MRGSLVPQHLQPRAVNEGARDRDHAQGEKLWTLPYTFAAFSGAMVEGSQAAISLAVILAGGGPLAIAAVIFVCQGLAYLVLTILARRSVAWFRGGYRHARLLAIQELLVDCV